MNPRKLQFGGSWTHRKLQALLDYLPAYTTIFTKNEKARYFQTIYLDAFAGTGRMTYIDDDQGSLFSAADQDYLKGSATQALEVQPEFNRYIFIENDPIRSKQLEALKKEFPNKAARIEIHTQDANEFLLHWCNNTDWKKYRAVVFLDPFAMDVPWSTIEAIAATKGIDLWYLFPCGAFNRLLTRSKKPPEKWAAALTRICGTTEWQTKFYSTNEQPGLFGSMVSEEKVSSSFDAIDEFFRGRLQKIFAKVAEQRLILETSKSPIFMLFFAAGNPKGAKTAVNIANSVMKN
jgi:three-Cys-motif partner protein